jgi:hypothetical protein
MSYRIPPTHADIEIANAVLKYASPRSERAAELLTWGADEHVLLALAAAWWLSCRGGSLRDRANSNHILMTTLAVSVIPHLLKMVFDQRRPDRLTVRGHLHGIPISGKPDDAFPSGHAMHVGALASAASVLSPVKRNLIWGFSATLALTRIALLAHWASDVVAGLLLGAFTERLLRPMTGFGNADKKTPAQGPGSGTGRNRQFGDTKGQRQVHRPVPTILAPAATPRRVPQRRRDRFAR